jgi:hypothetical protein
MCSSQSEPSISGVTSTALAAATGGLPPMGLVELLHGVLDEILSTDLTVLGGDELAELMSALVRAGHRHSAAVLDVVAAFDSADVASTSRHRTTKRWLEHRTHLSPGTAGHLVRTARTVRDHLPATRDALADGSVSAQHVSAITAVVGKVGVEHAVTAEPILLDLARRREPSVVRRATAHLHSVIDPAGAEAALHATYERRGVTLSVVGDRAYLDGVLDVESAELLRAALTPLMARSGETDRRTTPQRRADALVDVAKRQLDSGALPEIGGERPHLSVVVNEAVLRTQLGAVTLDWTGVAVPAGVVRRWGCDAQLTPVLARALPPMGTATPGAASTLSATVVGGGWLPLDVGRASRLVTTAQLKALRVRDGGCVHPGCSRTVAYCDAHHVQHWADGGRTDMTNLALLCRHHHRTLHAREWTLTPDVGKPGRFWASTAGWDRPAQTAADRSPSLQPDRSPSIQPDRSPPVNGASP